MDDDFVINFATSTLPSTSTLNATKVKGGRWTDRVKDKRRQQGQQRRQSTSSSSATTPTATTTITSLGKRTREDHDDEAGIRTTPKGSITLSRPSTTTTTTMTTSHRHSNGTTTNDSDDFVIQPRRGPLAKKQNTGAPSTSTSTSTQSSVVHVGGKKQYISSLFSSEGLPASSTSSSSTTMIPSQPSNAPLRHEPTVEMTSESTEVKPDPAPALTALGLMPELVSHLANKLDITGPTACQAGSIPPLLTASCSVSTPNPNSSHRALDAILQAQTGSGKTLAFLLPMLQDLLSLDSLILGSNTTPTRSIGTLSLILAPTRELASQIYTVLEQLLSLPSSNKFNFPPRALTPCLLVGGANRTHEKSRLRKGCPIIIATPGRLLDHLKTTESFRFAGEPIKSKGPRGRLGLTGSNTSELGSRGIGARKLGLRWLIVDECDRLMDLGFEEQMKGVLEELEKRSPSMNLELGAKGRRRTILCSATAGEGVERLKELALGKNGEPVLLKAKKDFKGVVVVPSTSTSTSTNEERSTELSNGDDSKVSFTPPTQLVHNYIVCPPKLRFVGLIALLRRLLVAPNSTGRKGQGTKVLIFLSCTAAVDFYWEALGSMGMGSTEKEPETNKIESTKDRVEREKREIEEKRTKLASRSKILPGVPVYRLHGNLELETRLNSLKAFSTKSEVKEGKLKGIETENAVLLCTSVAARGLDVPFVSHVVQYDLPTEGGVTEYIHRVGRTARAGASGQATSFLLPSEKEWVPWVENGMKEGVVAARNPSAVKEIKMREIGIEEILKGGYGGDGREYETRATDVQMGFERWVAEETENATLARNAFTSHIRAYATHPAAEKSMFNTKALHLGHLAKSFGMREAPGATSSTNKKGVKKMGRVEEAKMQKVLKDGGFETGRRDTGPKNLKQLMRGPTGDSEFHVASKEMLETMAKGSGGVGKKR